MKTMKNIKNIKWIALNSVNLLIILTYKIKNFLLKNRSNRRNQTFKIKIKQKKRIKIKKLY